MNKKKWIGFTVAIILLTNVMTFYVSYKWSLALPNGKVNLTRAEYDEFKKFGKLFTVKDKLNEYYDGKINDADLVEGAVKGMTASLNDPYTVFMNQKEWKDFNEQTTGEYVGLGLQVGVKDNKITVIAPFEDSPAQKAGILPEDVIEKVNGTDVSGQDLEKAVNMMKKGKEGEKVTLTISRTGKQPFNVDVKRAKIVMVTVKGEMLDSSIGYIRLTMFDENTAKNFNAKLKELQGKGMKKLVLDLRGNPGGLLDQCVEVVSNFVPKGKVIVSTIDKYKKEERLNSRGGTAVGVPLVVLVDEGSASASEIVSGAIRDYKVGTLVGKKTFGKGVVQTLLYQKKDGFNDGTALKVTIARYYTPNGENIQGKGINPNVEVDYPIALKEKGYNRNEDPQFKKALDIIKGLQP